jgi:hypothetical protein
MGEVNGHHLEHRFVYRAPRWDGPPGVRGEHQSPRTPSRWFTSPSTAGPVLVIPRDRTERLFVLLDRLPKGLEEGLRIDWRSDDSGVKLRCLTLSVVLTEIQHEFEGIVADLEVIGVPTFKLTEIHRVCVTIIHHSELDSDSTQYQKSLHAALNPDAIWAIESIRERAFTLWQ